VTLVPGALASQSFEAASPLSLSRCDDDRKKKGISFLTQIPHQYQNMPVS